MSEFTADQLEEGILNALRAHDAEAVVALVEALAAVDFERGKTMFEALKAGVALGKAFQ